MLFGLPALGFSDLTFPIQTFPLECSLLDVWVSPQSPSVSQYILPAWNQGHWCKGLIVLAAISQKHSLFPVSPSWILRHQAPWLLEPGPSPLCSTIERRRSAFIWVRTSLGTFLDYEHMGSYLSVKPNHLPSHDFWERVLFKEALFLWEGSFCLDFEGGGVTTNTALLPNFFTSGLLIKDESIF